MESGFIKPCFKLINGLISINMKALGGFQPILSQKKIIVRK